MGLRVEIQKISRATKWIRNKYRLKSYETSVKYTEKEFNCKLIWDDGYCFLEFNEEQDYTAFVLKWI